MKFRVTWKDPDYDLSIEDRGEYPDYKKAEEAARNFLCYTLRAGEYVTVECDTETGEGKVVRD